MIVMLHGRGCGGLIAKSASTDFQPHEKMLLRSQDFILTSTGQRPLRGSPIICPRCKVQVSVKDLEFAEDG